MAHLTIDDFIEGFAASLVERGHRAMRLNDAEVRDGLYNVYRSLEQEISKSGSSDSAWRISLSNIRNVFLPSPIGSFDEFEALLRAKQLYLTNHPNPYYQDIVIKLPSSVAKRIIKGLSPKSSVLINKTVQAYLSASADHS